VSLEEIFRILNIQEHLGDSPDAHEIDTVKGEVTFDNVCFHYSQSGRLPTASRSR
jgi:ATP-binding cassette, subfamily B, bacterial